MKDLDLKIDKISNNTTLLTFEKKVALWVYNASMKNERVEENLDFVK